MSNSIKSLSTCSTSNTTRSSSMLDAHSFVSISSFYEDFYRIRFLTFHNSTTSLLCSPSYMTDHVTFDNLTIRLDSKPTRKRFYSSHSVPNLKTATEIRLISKHLSLINLKCIYYRRRSQVETRSIFFVHQMSGFKRLTWYWSRLGDSFRQLVQSTLIKLLEADERKPTPVFRGFTNQQEQKANLYAISEETIETYEITELNDLAETKSMVNLTKIDNQKVNKKIIYYY